MNKQFILLAAVVLIACNFSFSQTNYQWRYSSGGAGNWQNLKSDATDPANLRFGDFNGDDKTDVFTSVGGQWKYSPNGTGEWINLANDPSTPIANLAFGDFNGDGTTDVFRVNSNGHWQFSSGGTQAYLDMATETVAFPSLRFGDFNGDHKTDVFTRDASGQWKYSSGGTSSWINLAVDANVPLVNLRFADLNGDEKTDVFTRDASGQWKFSSGGSGNWTNLAQDPSVTLSDLRFGKFNADTKFDVFTSVNGQWKYSGGGSDSWTPLAVDAAVPLAELQFGDFNDDGKTDVFHASASASSGGGDNGGTGPSVSMKFTNIGNKTAELYRATSTSVGEKVLTLTGKGSANMSVRMGERFVVKIDGRTDLHPTIVMSDLSSTGIIVYGQLPYNDVKLATHQMVDYLPNRLGIDLKFLNPRNLLASTASKEPLFEAFSMGDVDYTIDAQSKVMKRGFQYASEFESRGSSDVKMAHGFTSFSKQFSLNVSAGGTVKGVEGNVGVGYNSYSSEEKRSESVYAYTLEQKSVFRVKMDPKEARLDQRFINDVLAVNSAASAQALIEKYGTHFSKVVHYGGDRSVYLQMSKESYSKAKGYGIDVKASVSASSQKLSKQTVARNTGGTNDGQAVNTNEYTNGKVAEGSIGVGYSEDQVTQSVMQQTTSKYRMIGGNGGFDNWTVTEATAAPVSLEVGVLTELIDAAVFKDGTDPATLAQKRQLIQQAIDAYLADMLVSPFNMPLPRVYAIELTKITVEDDGPDSGESCRQMKGSIDVAFSANQNERVQYAHSDKTLWSHPEMTDIYLFQEGNSYPIVTGNRATVVHTANPDSTFPPLYVTIGGTITENDCAPNPDDDMTGWTGWMPITMDNLLRAGHSIAKEGDVAEYSAHMENSGQKIRFYFKVMREKSEFMTGF